MNKIISALSVVAVLGSATAAFAYEAPENKLGDRYPFLEQQYRPVATPAGQYHATTAGLYMNQVPENKIGDRYPWLEAPTKIVTVKSTVRANRVAKSFAIADKALFDRQSMRAVF